MVFLKNSLQPLLMYQPLWRAMLILSAMAILYLATTNDPYPIPSASSDKLNHVLAFTHLTIVARLAWPGLSRIWIVLGVMAFGLSIELIQAHLPYREFSLLDLAADGVGVAIGLFPCGFIFGRDRAPAESRV